MKAETFVKEILKRAFPQGRATAKTISVCKWVELHEAFNQLTDRMVERGEITAETVDKLYKAHMGF